MRGVVGEERKRKEDIEKERKRGVVRVEMT